MNNSKQNILLIMLTGLSIILALIVGYFVISLHPLQVEHNKMHYLCNHHQPNITKSDVQAIQQINKTKQKLNVLFNKEMKSAKTDQERINIRMNYIASIAKMEHISGILEQGIQATLMSDPACKLVTTQ